MWMGCPSSGVPQVFGGAGLYIPSCFLTPDGAPRARFRTPPRGEGEEGAPDSPVAAVTAAAGAAAVCRSPGRPALPSGRVTPFPGRPPWRKPATAWCFLAETGALPPPYTPTVKVVQYLPALVARLVALTSLPPLPPPSSHQGFLCQGGATIRRRSPRWKVGRARRTVRQARCREQTRTPLRE